MVIKIKIFVTEFTSENKLSDGFVTNLVTRKSFNNTVYTINVTMSHKIIVYCIYEKILFCLCIFTLRVSHLFLYIKGLKKVSDIVTFDILWRDNVITQ